jgi:enoyl-CoA hydratase/carnithine racemase
MTIGGAEKGSGLRVETVNGGAVLLLRIARPAARNALDFATLDEIARVAESLTASGREDVRAVIVTGTAGMFAAGGDLRELAQVVTAADAEVFAERGARACRALGAIPVPVVAAVSGGAYGGGAELALACDVRVGDASTVFGFRQARMGVTTAWGTASTLVSLVGHGRASRLLFAADDIGADKALAFGLLDEMAPDGETAEATASNLAGLMTRVSGTAAREQKKLLRSMVAMPAVVAEAERAAFVRTWTDTDHAEAMRAFAERRPPSFLPRPS